ncbi:alpha/beta fold hydrolase [Microbacterium sp. YY-01]|uniref:alpha/beta fold hydrolase n=1 Tax=Microbacterium sp. YY-01 TaxID=3421634 RepID=UPI003D178469
MEQSLVMRDVRGVRTAVYDTGPRSSRSSNATLVMVHGGDVRSLSDAADWSTIWHPDTIGARLIAYDKPGQGRSYQPGMSGSAVSLSALTAHLEELVAGVGHPVTLMGHSRGALPVADVALRSPHLVNGVVLVSSNTLAPPSPLTPTDFYLRAYADPPHALTEEYVRRELVMNSYDASHVDNDILRARHDAAMESGWWNDREHRMLLYPSVADSLQRGRELVLEKLVSQGLKVPVLTFWGRNDVSAPHQLGESLMTLLTGSSKDVTAVQVNRSGHYVYREHPEVFMAHTAAFLAGLRH